MTLGQQQDAVESVPAPGVVDSDSDVASVVPSEPWRKCTGATPEPVREAEDRILWCGQCGAVIATSVFLKPKVSCPHVSMELYLSHQQVAQPSEVGWNLWAAPSE